MAPSPKERRTRSESDIDTGSLLLMTTDNDRRCSPLEIFLFPSSPHLQIGFSGSHAPIIVNVFDEAKRRSARRSLPHERGVAGRLYMERSAGLHKLHKLHTRHARHTNDLDEHEAILTYEKGRGGMVFGGSDVGGWAAGCVMDRLCG